VHTEGTKTLRDCYVPDQAVGCRVIALNLMTREIAPNFVMNSICLQDNRLCGQILICDENNNGIILSHADLPKTIVETRQKLFSKILLMNWNMEGTLLPSDVD
jgi:hypothetical protein